MRTNNPNPEATQVSALNQSGAIREPDAEPMERPDLADAEEEEFAELWASDRGNQGA